MTSAVKLHDEARSGPALVSVLMVVARATGRDGACSCDGWSCWYPWVGYHLTGVRRGACFVL